MLYLILIDSYDDRVTQIVDEEYLNSPEYEAFGGKVLASLESPDDLLEELEHLTESEVRLWEQELWSNPRVDFETALIRANRELITE